MAPREATKVIRKRTGLTPSSTAAVQPESACSPEAEVEALVTAPTKLEEGALEPTEAEATAEARLEVSPEAVAEASVSPPLESEGKNVLQPTATVGSDANDGSGQENKCKGVTVMEDTIEGAAGIPGKGAPESIGEVKSKSQGRVAAEASGEVNDSEPANIETEEMQVEEGKKDPEECGTDPCGNVDEPGGIESINVDQNDDNSVEENEDINQFNEPPMEKEKQKVFEIFVGGLHRKADENDLTDVFGSFGDIHSIRLVKNVFTQKSKGFAFIRYADTEHAKKVLTEMKDGVEIKGKKVALSASMQNRTLYLGNICKTWIKNQVLETLTKLGLENVMELRLVDDPDNEGRNKGYAFVEFNSHYDAMAAFQRLGKPDAVFGSELSAEVAFEQPPVQSNEEHSLVKTVRIDGIPKSWDKNKVKELCKQYGEIERIHLPHPKKWKKKYFGFVVFASRDDAIACVEGINSVNFQENDVKVTAGLAKPRNKSRLANIGTRGGFVVDKTVEADDKAESAKSDGEKNSTEVDKGKVVQNSGVPKGVSPSKFPCKVGGNKGGRASRGKKRGGKDRVNGQSSKRARRAPPATSYRHRVYSRSSVSASHSSDMEPHAGFVPSRKRRGNSYESSRSRLAAAYGNQPLSTAGYAGVGAFGSRNQSSYPAYPSYGRRQVSHAYPVVGPYAHQRQYY